MYFDELPLSDEILDALWDMHFEECTPIQAAAIPVILSKKDVIACAQTGTGKTAAYILPLLDNLLCDGHSPEYINAIIMSPTRELAHQIDQQMEGFSYYMSFSSVPIYGGNDGSAWDIQSNGLKKGADVVIATPGRLISHLKVGDIDFSHVRYFILDEADRMLDMGFLDDILTIVKQLPKTRQTIMFSATMPNDLRHLAKTIMREPEEINIAISRPPDTIHQQAVICYEAQKLPLLKLLLRQDKYADMKKIILFAGKKQTVKDLLRQLVHDGIQARAMHSDLEQSERDEVMLAFRNGKVRLLVATDIVSRGIDVDDIPLVINYDVPRDGEDYVHRIGRTARAENLGEAITLVNESDQVAFARIEALIHKDVEKLSVPESLGESPAYHPHIRGKSRQKAKGRYYHKKNKSHSSKDKS